jgi:hypothetical protein
MRNYRFIEELNEAEKRTLQECFLYHKSSDCRIRAHGVLLNAKKYTIDQIADILDVDRDTIK